MDLKDRTFEEVLGRLEVVVRELEDGRAPLEQALELYAEGIQLSRECYSRLEAADQRISVLQAGEGGELWLKPVESPVPRGDQG
ncbi:MAG: exodeoxyribonuclease VII small subunit [Bacillota bacterium]